MNSSINDAEDPSINYSNLLVGNPISRRSYVVDRELVRLYKLAVQDKSKLLTTGSDISKVPLAPPMSISALSLRGVVNDLKIPGGTLHVGQETEYKKPVAIGETLHCEATVSSNNVRGEWRFMGVELKVTDSKGDIVMNGKSTILLPVKSEQE